MVQRLNTFRSIFGFDKSGKRKAKKRSTFVNCLLVWDTVASFGLASFCADVVDYVKCSIQMNNNARTSMVIVVGTTLHVFECQVKAMHLSCLFYHLPSAEICLFSP